MKIQFNDFMECNESARMIINSYWLEYILNLFHQGYFGEIWEELMDTKINLFNTLETITNVVIARSLR